MSRDCMKCGKPITFKRSDGKWLPIDIGGEWHICRKRTAVVRSAAIAQAMAAFRPLSAKERQVDAVSNPAGPSGKGSFGASCAETPGAVGHPPTSMNNSASCGKNQRAAQGRQHFSERYCHCLTPPWDECKNCPMPEPRTPTMEARHG